MQKQVRVFVETNGDAVEEVKKALETAGLKAEAYKAHPVNFFLDERQARLANDWCQSQRAKLAEKQMANSDFTRKHLVKKGRPYTGAVGGQFRYTFANCSLGQSAKVIDSMTNEELDLTDYDW